MKGTFPSSQAAAWGVAPGSWRQDFRRYSFREKWLWLFRRRAFARHVLERQAARCLNAGLFDSRWYLAHNPDVGAAGMEPVVHFLRFGLWEGRRPNAGFQWERHEALLRRALDWLGTPEDAILHPPTPEASGPATAGQAWLLDQDYGLPASAWTGYRQALLAAGARAVSPPRSGRLRVCLRSPVPVDPGLWRRSLDSLAGLEARPIILAGPGLDADDFVRAARREATLPVRESWDALVADLEPGDDVLWLFPGDLVDPAFPGVLAGRVPAGADVVLCDLLWRQDGRVYPWLLHGPDPVQARHAPYHLSRVLVRGALLAASAPGGDDDPEARLRAVVQASLEAGAGAAVHLPVPLLEVAVSREALDRQKLALLARAQASPAPASETRLVGVVVCTRNGGHRLDALVNRLLGEPLVAEVVVVSNNTDEAFARGWLGLLGSASRVRLVRYDKTFNFSAQCNLGARQVTAPLLLFLNDDTFPVTADWLARLVATLDENGRDDTVVGPLLLYPDYTVQEAGMFLGFRNVAGHSLRHGRLGGPETNFFLHAPRQVSCLTGAAMLLSRRLFTDCNGFDPMLASYLQDVDLCLRLLHGGQRLVFEPRAQLLHFESLSVKQALVDARLQRRRGDEHAYFLARWGAWVHEDPWLSPLLDSGDESLRQLKVPTP